jgi:diadenosine tetraphosphatase ApaH/serine/threonine PP2A family protein phosphatase
MLIAIFSDVHANLEALEKVLRYYKGQSPDRYIFLGDAVGYGPNPNEVCNLLRDLKGLTMILGNHDAAVAGRMPYNEYYDAARQALDWTAEQLSAENRVWLKSIPYKVSECECTFSHGSPIVPEAFEYLFIPEQILDLYDVWDSFSSMTFIGHSHLSISFKFDEENVTPLIADEIVYSPKFKYIVTVGSVGQPRDRDPRACCGLYDTEKRVFRYQRIDYDQEKTKKKIIKAGLAAAFGERLLVGM